MRVQLLFVAALVLFAAACNAGGSNSGIPSASGVSLESGALARVQPDVDHTSVLKLLTKQQIVGKTVDPLDGDQNPYGLVYVASKPLGKSILKVGDLVVCNFNDKANVQGTGTTVDYISSAVGSSPKRFQQNGQLLGCASLAINTFDEVFAADSGAKNATGITSNGKITQTLKSSLLVEPWGSVYVPSQTGYPPGDGLWVSDASSGKIIRINLGTGSQPTYTAVISGFAVNGGKPGNILGPSGLQYNAATDTLFAVDGVTNTVVAFSHAYNALNGTNSIVVGKDGKTFSGPKSKYARLIHGGFPLDGPISSTLLPNGNLVLGNTLNKNGVNLLVEIATDGKVLDTKNVDTGAAGALFGIAASGTSDDTTKIYFNDDNQNNIQVLSKP